jgi:putative transposase
LTPEQVHYGRGKEILQKRSIVLDDAFKKHPKCFKGGIPQPLPVPQAAWINPPKPSASSEETK